MWSRTVGESDCPLATVAGPPTAREQYKMWSDYLTRPPCRSSFKCTGDVELGLMPVVTTLGQADQADQADQGGQDAHLADQPSQGIKWHVVKVVKVVTWPVVSSFIPREGRQ